MHPWISLLFSLCLTTAIFLPETQCQETISQDGLTDNDIDAIQAGETGLYPTGMYDDTINYNEDIIFHLFSIYNPYDGQQLYLNNQTSLSLSNFDSSKLTKFIIHGFRNNLNSSMVQTIKDEYLQNYDCNVIIVDWGALASNILYPVVVSKVPAVGNYVALFINFLVTKASAVATDIHVVGHSIGAHVAGFAGKAVQNLGYNISRITGLDVALPGYAFDSPDSRISKTDADYVDCIHTCGGSLGFARAICQSDFFPNGGTPPQPGCPALSGFGSCSHGRSWGYFAASIDSSNVFSTKTCSGFLLGLPIGCSQAGALMGNPAGVGRHDGQFYLTTTDDWPYAE